jgi:hypothetical protein
VLPSIAGLSLYRLNTRSYAYVLRKPAATHLDLASIEEAEHRGSLCISIAHVVHASFCVHHPRHRYGVGCPEIHTGHVVCTIQSAPAMTGRHRSQYLRTSRINTCAFCDLIGLTHRPLDNLNWRFPAFSFSRYLSFVGKCNNGMRILPMETRQVPTDTDRTKR